MDDDQTAASDDEQATAPSERKRELRERMRSLRRSLDDRDVRSRSIFEQLVVRRDVQAARHVMAFTSIRSEPHTEPFLEWCRINEIATAVPEDDVDPGWPDIVIVPGLAFTPDGRRCGQGGGWYDRFLPNVRGECVTIGVCFAPQLVDDLPTEPHDVTVDAVLTD